MPILNNELIFWALFFFFNFSLFAFNYIVHARESCFFPINPKSIRAYQFGLILSENPDFFRLAMDISFLILFVRFTNYTAGFSLGGIYYGFIFLFNIYHFTFKRLYHINPTIVNDWKLLKNGLGILWEESKLKVVLASLLLLSSGICYAWGFTSYLEFASRMPINRSLLAGTGIVLMSYCLSIYRKPIFVDQRCTYHRFLITPLRVYTNLKYSWKLLRERSRTDFQVLKSRRRIEFDLERKPNIYLLFIESYGSILLREPSIRSGYLENYRAINARLQSKGWYSQSNLSRSVSLNGPSWLAYMTVLLGSQVKNNFNYEYLLNNPEFHQYDSLTRTFQERGYISYNLNATKPMKGVNAPLDLMKGLYGVDEWILHADIPYAGKKYGFSESPPDEYVLNFAYEHFLKECPQPFLLFYLTKTSHSPFISPHTITEDWRSLNSGRDQLIGKGLLDIPTIEDYAVAIHYQLQMIGDFIYRNGSERDVFLIIGDHQPHGISTMEKHGLETMVHVVSKDQAFLRGFQEYGFSDDPERPESSIRHEAIYSLFLREIIRNYSSNNTALPDYEPTGIIF